MKLLCDNELIKIQDEYLELLLSKEKQFTDDNMLNIREIAYFIDEIEVFWRKKLQLMEHLINRLTNNYDVYLLSAVMYLGINTNEHYTFKAIGDYQCVTDPISKFDVFIRQGMTHLGSDPIEVFFKRSYLDTVNALENYKHDFIFIPSALMTWSSNEHMRKTLYKDASNIIKSMFVEKIDNLDEYLDGFETMDEIESKIRPDILPIIRLTEEEQEGWSFDEKFNYYFESHGLESFIEEHRWNTKEMFLMPMTGLLSQALDSIYQSFMMNMTPFIRQNLPFMYLMIMFQSDDSGDIEELLKKAIICHMFYQTYDNDVLAEHPFDIYKEKFNGKNLIQEILNEKIDISDSLKNLVELIKSKYDIIFQSTI